jgi:hypothetical protein
MNSDQVICETLAREVPLRSDLEPAWEDVLRRATSLVRPEERPRPRLTRRRVVATAVVAVALVVPALAIGGVLDPLFGVSNPGTPVKADAFTLTEIDAHQLKDAGLVPDPAKPGTFALLALRDGIGVYTARSKADGSACFWEGQRRSTPGQPSDRLYLDGPGCDPNAGGWELPDSLMIGSDNAEAVHAWLSANPFPSPGRPLMDMSGGETTDDGYIYLPQLVGVAADPVHSIQLLAMSDCHVVVTVPVIDNVYIDANPPKVAEAFLVALDADGNVIWHSGRLAGDVPTPLDPAAPQNCGFGLAAQRGLG